MTLLEINRLLPIYIDIVPLKFEIDIQSQSKVCNAIRKPKNPIWAPGGHFESDFAENQKASACGHHQHAYEIWKLNFQSKLDLCSGNHVVYRRTDGRTDGQGESSIPPSNFVGREYNKFSLKHGDAQQFFVTSLIAVVARVRSTILGCVEYE